MFYITIEDLLYVCTYNVFKLYNICKVTSYITCICEYPTR